MLETCLGLQITSQQQPCNTRFVATTENCTVTRWQSRLRQDTDIVEILYTHNFTKVPYACQRIRRPTVLLQ